MSRIPAIFKNKYIVSTAFVIFYVLFMHDTDIFTLIKRKDKVSIIQKDIAIKKKDIAELKIAFEKLDDIRTIEKIGREEHLFKKDDEDLFIFSFD